MWWEDYLSIEVNRTYLLNKLKKCPRSSTDRASASGAGGAGSIPAGDVK